MLTYFESFKLGFWGSNVESYSNSATTPLCIEMCHCELMYEGLFWNHGHMMNQQECHKDTTPQPEASRINEPAFSST